MSETIYAATMNENLADTQSRQWRQVLARDPSADGAFVYAVRTTGIFCRPSCPSRRPAPHNVTFFPTAGEAQTAGFRACLRCHPERLRDPRREMIARAAELAQEGIGLEDLARATGARRLTVMRGFRNVLGVTPGEFARGKKFERFRYAVQLGPEESPAAVKPTVRGPDGSITDAIYKAGFGSPSRLYERSAAALGMTPRAMRQGGAGMMIRYATADTPLGRMLVAATELGICAILFAETDVELLNDLRRRFGRAELVPSAGEDRWFAQAVAYVASQTTEHPLAPTFPLDVRATAFQVRVWKALGEIPRGETRSYSEVARNIGRADAVRAVAAAIGANPIAVAVPCHRVLGKDGSMTGYRWGIDRKRTLLAAEKAGVSPSLPAGTCSPGRALSAAVCEGSSNEPALQ